MVKNNYFNRFRKGKGKAKPKARKPRAPRMTFAQKVNKIIASNVENKFTKTVQSISSICRLTSNGGPLPTPVTTSFAWYAYSPQHNDHIFDISQGTAQSERIGNKIKIKRWIIKGSIQPAVNFLSGQGTKAANSQCGYVDVYFGRYQNNIVPVNGTLSNFYQNGAADTTPTGSQGDKLARVNKNLYKVYWHKRFKVGLGSGQIYNVSPPLFTEFNGVQMTAGQGFKPSHTFGFDVCKYICKNRILQYDELVNSPQDPDVQNLTLWATFIPVASELDANPAPSGTTVVNDTMYEILTATYAEYEDA